MSVWPVIPIAVPVAAAAVGVLVRRSRGLQRAVSLTAASSAVVAGTVMLESGGQRPMRAVIGELPARFAIVLFGDPLAALLVLAAGVLTLAVLVFAIAGSEDHHPFLAPVIVVLLGGACGTFLAADLFNLFVAMEVTLAASYVLATIQGTRAQVRAGVVYIATNVMASLLLLVAIAWIYTTTGTVNIGVLAERGSGPPLVAGALLLTALGVKAAVVPVGGWLPVAYRVAPRAVAGLFAGLLTTVGVAAIYRVHSLVLHDEPRLRAGLLVVAAATCIVGALAAASRSSPEETVAFVLVAQAGFMLLGVGLAGAAARAAGIFFIAQDVLVKTAAFLAVGTARDAVDAEGTATAQVRPVLAAAAIVAALSLTGIPPTSGFVGKFLLLRAAADDLQPAIVVAVLAASFAVLMALVSSWRRLFETPRDELDRLPRRTSRRRTGLGRTGPVVVLVVAALIVGVLPSWLTRHARDAAGWLHDTDRYAEAVLR